MLQQPAGKLLFDLQLWKQTQQHGPGADAPRVTAAAACHAGTTSAELSVASTSPQVVGSINISIEAVHSKQQHPTALRKVLAALKAVGTGEAAAAAPVLPTRLVAKPKQQHPKVPGLSHMGLQCRLYITGGKGKRKEAGKRGRGCPGQVDGCRRAGGSGAPRRRCCWAPDTAPGR